MSRSVASFSSRCNNRGWQLSASHAFAVSLALACGVLNVSPVSSAPSEDLVVSLPEFGPPPTAHYSGFLDATDGCDTSVNGAYCKIHYWLCTAEEEDASDDAITGTGAGVSNTSASKGDEDEDEDKPLTTFAKKPVVLWLNGGPGSSSILGLLQENGPLLMNATGGLMVNPYSWTKLAHLLILESPVGVGYSHCEAQAQGGRCQNTDKFTATTARAALVSFFDKFPELAGLDFYATGESYAGVYLPTLAYEIVLYNDNAPNATAEINLKGLAVGDPCTDNTAQQDSMDALWYGHKYGLVDDAVFDVLWNQCNVRLPNPLMKHFNAMDTLQWRHMLRSGTARSVQVDPSTTTIPKDECDLAVKKFLWSTSLGLSQGWSNMYIDDYSLFAPVTDAEDEAMKVYMNRPDVRRALHVDQAPIATWPYPDAGFDYTKEYDACNEDVGDDAVSMIDFYRKLAPKLSAIWIYNGDTDPCVSYEGTRTAVKRIGLPELDGGGYRPWFYNHTKTTMAVLQEKAVMFGPDLLLHDTGVQFGGEIVNYQHGLAFLTVHGSGHMVPQFRPQAALHMLQKFLTNDLLSPLLPTNATLSAMTDDKFMDAMDAWTVLAKSSQYVG